MKSKSLKKLTALALVAVMVLALAACGGGGATNNDPGSTSSPGSNPGSTNTVQSAGGSDKIVLGTTVIYDTIDPFTNPQEAHLMVYETLGGREGFGGEFHGLLMESWEQVDDTTYNIKLYDNITDSAGHHITADDVVFSWETAQAIGKLTKISVIESVTKVDDLTAQFKWKEKPNIGSSFETMMSTVNIVSKEAYEADGNGMNTNPVGTGPYTMTAYTAGVSIAFEARDDYWQPAEKQTLSSQKQNIKEIEIQTISETAQMAMALQTGKVDATKNLSSQDVPAFKDGGQYAASYTVMDVTGEEGVVMYPNLSADNKLADENLRKAVFSAIDRDFIAKAIQSGYCDPLYSMGSTLLQDYNPAWKDVDIQYDVEAAKQYLADAGYANGVTLKLIFPNIGNLNDIAVFIQGQLGQVGITLEIDAQNFGNYLGNEHDPSAWDFVMAPITATDYCVSVMGQYFDIRQTGTGSSKNFLNDDELQSLLETAQDPDTFSQSTVDAVWTYIAQNAYAEPLINPNIFYVFNSSKISAVVVSGEGKMLPNAFTYI